MIVVVDYGMGNLHSVTQAIRRFGVEVVCTTEPTKMFDAQAIILPGVGAFGQAMEAITSSGLDTAIVRAVQQGIPLLGICLGMQLLFDASEEHGYHRGLGLIAGRVVKIDRPVKVPHMGWNELSVTSHTPICADVNQGHVYFVHSYQVLPEQRSHILAVTEYEGEIVAIVGRDHIYGMQFHPEKSGFIGWKLLRNFLHHVGVLSVQQLESYQYEYFTK